MRIIERMIAKILISIVIISLIITNAQSKSENNLKKVFGLALMKNMLINVDINDAIVDVKGWIHEINNKVKLGMDANPILFNNMNDLYRNYKKDDIKMIVCNPVDYLENRDILSMTPMFVDTTFDEFIILAKDKNLNSLPKLKNKKITIQLGANFIIAQMWLKVLLKENKLGEYASYFKEINDGALPSQIILSVYFGKYDACIVKKSSFKTMIEVNPQLIKSLHVLETSPSFIDGMACGIEGFTKTKEGEIILNAAHTIEGCPSGKNIITLLRIKSIKPFKASYLISTEMLLARYHNLFKKK